MGVSFGAGGSQKDQVGNTANYFLGDDPTSRWSPSLDLVYKLSDMANQSNAQSNLLFGGAGYGGSFETASQRAARENGLTENSKPYGGWGGYGSSSPVQYWDPTNTRPDWNGGQPVYPGQTSPANAPPSGSASSPTGGGWPQPGQPGGVPLPGQPGGPALPPNSAQWTPEGGYTMYADAQTRAAAPSYTNSVQAPQQLTAEQQARLDRVNQIIAKNGWSPETVAKLRADAVGGAPVNSKEFFQQQKAAQVKDWQASGRSAQEVADLSKRYDQFVDIQDYLNQKGDVQGVNQNDVMNALAAGATPDDLKKHFGTILEQYGPRAFHYGHQIMGRLEDTSPEALAKMKAGTLASEYISSAGDISQGLTPGTQTAAAGPKRQGVGLGENSTQSVQSQQPAGASAASGASAGFDPITGRPLSQARKPSNAYSEMASMTMSAPPSGENVGYGGSKPPAEAKPGDEWIGPDGKTYTRNDDGTWSDPAGGHWNGGSGSTQPVGGVGTGGTGGNPYGGGGTGGGNTGGGGKGGGPATQNNGNGGGGAQGNSYWNNPVPGFGYYQTNPDGTPANGHYAFEQGSNGQYTPDAWSTSAPWRPTEPTGGIYGAFSEMAGGQLTPYENRIGEAWQGRAVDPGGWADQNYYNALAQYNASPGIGLKESYDAYNGMINSGGYSDSEKGAISGSAVRGVTAGYQRGMDDMKRQAARTGNANTAYAAMASMAPGYGAQLGETNRQNQIKFADEKARRNEAGAAGMTNVAALGNTKAQFGLNSQQQFANEMARRQETAIRGMGDYAAYGRGLQQQGLSGMSDLYKQQNANTQNYYNMIANLLGRQVGTRMYGESSGEGINVGATGGS